jgi:hypothetical protein
VSDSSLFVYKDASNTAYLLLYVDDIVLTASSPALLCNIMERLHSELAMMDLGELHHFLGILSLDLPAVSFCLKDSTQPIFYSVLTYLNVTLQLLLLMPV